LTYLLSQHDIKPSGRCKETHGHSIDLSLMKTA
jgi:hypothetical protein